jgi:hypothetical protein
MHNRSIFLAVALALAAVADGAGQGTSTAAGRESKDRSGAEVVKQSTRNLFALPGLDAEFHYRLQAYDQTLAGSGRYLQSGEGPEKLFRLELTTQLEGYKATQQTIGGKQYLWMRRDFGPEQRSLARVNLRLVRQAIEESGPPLSLDPSPTWMGIVGLPKMLSSLSQWFDFESARAERVGDREVLRVRGQMNRTMKGQLLSEKKGQGGEQIPDAVELTLGTDTALPLFPYRVEYLKRVPKDKSGTLAPLLTLDFFSAKVRRDIDPQQFEYFPGDQEVEDRTRLFLERLGFAAKEEKSLASADCTIPEYCNANPGNPGGVRCRIHAFCNKRDAKPAAPRLAASKLVTSCQRTRTYYSMYSAIQANNPGKPANYFTVCMNFSQSASSRFRSSPKAALKTATRCCGSSATSVSSFARACRYLM